MHDNINDKAAKIFMSQFQERTLLLEKSREQQRKAIDEKSLVLIPFRKFFKSLTDAGVVVANSGLHDPMATSASQAPQPFEVWETESSPSWAPGSSLYFDHPARVEIAVNNPSKARSEGLIMIGCSSNHPDSHLLKGPFYSVDDALMAVTHFLSRNTVRVDRPDFLR